MHQVDIRGMSSLHASGTIASHDLCMETNTGFANNFGKAARVFLESFEGFWEFQKKLRNLIIYCFFRVLGDSLFLHSVAVVGNARLVIVREYCRR